MKPLRRIILDLGQKRVNVSQLKDKRQQVEYIDSFGTDARPDFSKRGQSREIDTIPDTEFTSPPKRKNTKRRKQDPSERRTIVPRGLRLNVTESKLASIFKELKSLKMSDAPNAIAVLLRVFLELSVDHYMRRNQMSTRFRDPKSGREGDKKLSKKVEDVVNHLISQGHNRRDFNAVRRALDDSRSPLSIDLLHDYVHNLFVIPKRHHLMGAWDDAQPFFERIWS